MRNDVEKYNKDYYLIKAPVSEAVVPLTHFAASCVQGSAKNK